MWFLLLLSLVEISSQSCDCSETEQSLDKLSTEFENYQTQSLLSLKQIFNEDQATSGSSGSLQKLKKELLETKATLEKRTKALTAGTGRPNLNILTLNLTTLPALPPSHNVPIILLEQF